MAEPALRYYLILLELTKLTLHATFDVQIVPYSCILLTTIAPGHTQLGLCGLPRLHIPTIYQYQCDALKQLKPLQAR